MSKSEDEPTQPLYLEELAAQMQRPEHHLIEEEQADALPAPDPQHPVDRADVIGEGARSLAAWSGRFLLVVAAVGVTGYGLSYLGGAIIPLLMALIITSVLYPITAMLKRFGVPYGVGSVLALLAGIAVIGGLISLVAPSIVRQWQDLAAQTARGLEQVQRWASGPPLNLHDDQLNRYIQQITNWLSGHSGDLVSWVVSIGGSVSGAVVNLAMTLVIVFFMMKDGHKFVGWARMVVGRRGGFHVAELFTRVWNTLSGYIRAQALVSLVDAVFIGLGLWLLKVPLAFPIAILTFMAGFIPIIGAVTAGTVAVLVALVVGGPIKALLVVGLVVLVQQLEGNILQPVLQARVMQLHPVIVILAVLLGGGWFGITGAFLAVPVAASTAVMLRYLGDMIDLRTGERTAAEIAWATDDGVVVGGESEKSAKVFQDMVRRRILANPFAAAQSNQPDKKESTAEKQQTKLSKLRGLLHRPRKGKTTTEE